MLKTGFRTAGFAAWELGPTLQEIKRIGYDSVELCLEHPGALPEIMDDVRVRRVSKMLEELELELSSVSWHGDGSPMEERERRTLVALDVARRMGAKVFVMNSEAKDAAIPGQLAAVEDRLRRICRKAEEYKIDIAIEPEPRLVIESSRDLEQMIAKVCSPRLKANLDIGHAYITDPDVIDTIRRLGKLIVHTHVEDIAGKVHKHLLPGAGDMNLAAVFKALRENGFDGYFTIDLFNLGDNPDQTAGEALAALQKVCA